MGKLYISASYLLGLLCASAFALPALASTLSVDVSPTTGYSVTNTTTTALPPRTSSGPVNTYNPTVGPYGNGGAYQTTSSGITITGVKGNAGSTTMSGRINAGASAMKGAAFRCLSSMRCNIALIGGAAGIQALLDGIGGIIENGRLVVRSDSGSTQLPPALDYEYGQLPSTAPNSCPGGTISVYSYPSGEDEIHRCCSMEFQSKNLVGYADTGGLGTCQYGDGPAADPDWMYGPPYVPSPDQLDDLVSDNYQPDPSDLPFLSGGMDFSHPDVNFEIMDIPSITGSDSSTFIENSDGTSKGTYSEFEFSWSGPSKQPQVNADETTTETTYGPSGEIISTTITNNNSSGSPANNEIEIPTDCDFMPTVCRFIDWFTEPDPELSNEPDFTQLIDTIDIEREFTVGSSTASCPAPFQISLAWVPSVEVSLQPFCDLADLLRPFLLSLCFLYSGMIILRT